MPSRADIDPIDLPDLLGGIILVDVTEEPFDCRYRLVGTDIVEKIGHDPTGQSVAEGFLGPSADFVLDNYRAVVTERAVRFVDEPFEERRGWPVDAQRIFLPLSEDGERVNMVLVYATV